jgi:hypothetical protein
MFFAFKFKYQNMEELLHDISQPTVNTGLKL